MGGVTCLYVSADGMTALTGDRCRDNKTSYCNEGRGRSLIVWDLTTGERRYTLECNGWVNCLHVDGNTAWTGDNGKSLIEWDWTTGQRRQKYVCNGEVLCMHVSTSKVWTGDWGNRLIEWNLTDGKRNHELKCDGQRK